MIAVCIGFVVLVIKNFCFRFCLVGLFHFLINDRRQLARVDPFTTLICNRGCTRAGLYASRHMVSATDSRGIP
jgi:hypothetical protein